MDRYDAVVIGGGHNGLACAAYLAEAGRSVVVLERNGTVGGAARSARVFPAHDALLSKYSYLVSLLPELIVDELGLDIELRRREVSPPALGGLGAATTALAERVFPTLTESLRTAGEFRRLIGDEAWRMFVERPIGEAIEEHITDDALRGIVLTDALIGTFTHAHDLLANRCFLYHVVGRGTGHWDIPVGGMGAVSGQLAVAAEKRGAELVTDTEVVGVRSDGERAEVVTASGRTFGARQVFANVAPAVLRRLLGEAPSGPAPEGAQLKINMLLGRLPRLRDPGVTPREAFAGTFHVNEGYTQLETAYRQAAAGRIPSVAPCEVYCHSLADPSILSPELQAAGAQTLTVFALHMPARLFRDDPAGALAQARASVLASLDSVLAEPIEECLLDPDCIEVMGPLEIERELGMPGGHIFHRDLQWPFAESSAEEGRWGVETQHPNVFICGAGARRGGGVSAVPGRNAAMAALTSPAGGAPRQRR
jgi:phytoene dehydrogenase-like protein